MQILEETANVTWMKPNLCWPPHRVTHSDKLLELLEAFQASGWDETQPALIGYPDGHGVQLLSGSHRHAAALRADIDIPVCVYPYATVRAAWGDLSTWQLIMEGRVPDHNRLQVRQGMSQESYRKPESG